jgi:hypothetical protein
MMKVILSLALLAGFTAAQTVNVYSDNACQNLVTTYNCGDVWDSYVCPTEASKAE